MFQVTKSSFLSLLDRLFFAASSLNLPFCNGQKLTLTQLTLKVRIHNSHNIRPLVFSIIIIIMYLILNSFPDRHRSSFEAVCLNPKPHCSGGLLVRYYYSSPLLLSCFDVADDDEPRFI